MPFAQMQYIEIEQDNFETEMFNYQNWISSSLIPCFFDDDLQPPRKRNQEEDAPTRILNASTLGKYVGKVINLIRHKFPHHPDYAGLKSDEVPAWWSRDRKSFETECSDSHRRMAGSEYFVGQMETRPLYSDNIFVGYDGVLESPINDYISVIDLQSILKKLFAAATLDCNKEGKLQQRSWIAECFHAVGRGGEVKFIDTADFMYHPRYEVLDTKWTETKTRSKYSCPIVPNNVNIQTRAFHKMWEYEGKTVDVELQVRRKTNKSQTQEPTYMALGKRVRLHKQALAKSAGNSDYNREKLRPLPKEMPPGTPEDTISLRGLFGGGTVASESKDGEGPADEEP